MENENEFDHSHCHAEIARLKAKLAQCAIELNEAGAIIGHDMPAVGGLFKKAATVAAAQ